MPSSLGPAEILVILVVALIVLGPKRLPEAGRQIGRFVAEVRHWSATMQAETDAYLLEIHSGETIWKYRFARGDFALQESSRWIKGKQVERSRYTDFRVNTGSKIDFYKF